MTTNEIEHYYLWGKTRLYCNVDNDEKKAQTSKKIPENLRGKKTVWAEPED